MHKEKEAQAIGAPIQLLHFLHYIHRGKNCIDTINKILFLFFHFIYKFEGHTFLR